MKKIRYFKYNGTNEFWRFIGVWDAVAFRVVSTERYNGNILKVYSILFENGKEKPFKVVYFKNMPECVDSWWGRKGPKLLEWHNSADIREYKYKDPWDGKKSYVITVL